MKRPLILLLGALALGAAIFAGSYLAAQRASANVMRNTDDLGWLRSEFHLGDAEMARVRQVHEGYLPQCMEMCAKIAAKKAEVAATLVNGTNVTAVQIKLTELGELRAQCQAQMLQHFINVSQAMPPAEGRRYLTEMEKLTLGFHEEIEQTMDMPASHEHHQP